MAKSVCGKDTGSTQTLAVHVAREHLILRVARKRVLGGTCTVCLRSFASRSKCLDHIHEKGPVCLVNTLFSQAEYSEDDIAEANLIQRVEENASRLLTTVPF